MQALDPPLLSLAGSQELQSLGDQLATSLRTALKQVGRQLAPSQQGEPSGQQEDRSGDAPVSEGSGESAEDVEQQLLQAIALKLSDGGVGSAQLLELAKAYTAITSLRRAEEVELHLA